MRSIQRIKQRTGRPMQEEHGFTLIELMISIVVLSVGILAVGLLQNQSINNCTFAEYVTRNSTGAADQLEELMAADQTDRRVSGLGWTGGDTPDGTMNIIWNRQPQVANGNSVVLDLTATYIGNNFPNMPDPNINITIIKPFVR